MDERIQKRIEQQNHIFSIVHNSNGVLELKFCRDIEIQNLFIVLKGLVEDKSILSLYCLEQEFLMLYSKKPKFTRVELLYIPLHNIIEIAKIPKKETNVINLFP